MDLDRQRGRDHLVPHRGEGERVEHGHPAIGGGLGGEGSAGCLGELGGQIGGQRRTRLRRPGAQAQRPHDAAHLHRGGELSQPGLVLGVSSRGEAVTQLLGQRTALVVLGGRIGG